MCKLKRAFDAAAGIKELIGDHLVVLLRQLVLLLLLRGRRLLLLLQLRLHRLDGREQRQVAVLQATAMIAEDALRDGDCEEVCKPKFASQLATRAYSSSLLAYTLLGPPYSCSRC